MKAVYRLVDKDGMSFEQEELCYECAKEYHIQGRVIEIDDYIVFHYPDIIGDDEGCRKCSGTFSIDMRRKKYRDFNKFFDGVTK